MKKFLLLLIVVAQLLCVGLARAGNEYIVNPASSPVRVRIYPDASASATPQAVTDTNLGAKADTAASTDTGTFSLIALFKRSLQKLTTLGSTQTDGTQKTQVVNAAGTEVYTGTRVSSTAYEASHVLKSSAGTLISLIGYNSKASAQFIQLYNSTTVPADTAVPVLTITVPATSNFSVDVPITGTPFTTGIAVANSSTGPTKTVGGADVYFTAVVR